MRLMLRHEKTMKIVANHYVDDKEPKGDELKVEESGAEESKADEAKAEEPKEIGGASPSGSSMAPAPAGSATAISKGSRGYQDGRLGEIDLRLDLVQQGLQAHAAQIRAQKQALEHLGDELAAGGNAPVVDVPRHVAELEGKMHKFVGETWADSWEEAGGSPRGGEAQALLAKMRNKKNSSFRRKRDRDRREGAGSGASGEDGSGVFGESGETSGADAAQTNAAEEEAEKKRSEEEAATQAAAKAEEAGGAECGQEDETITGRKQKKKQKERIDEKKKIPAEFEATALLEYKRLMSETARDLGDGMNIDGSSYPFNRFLKQAWERARHLPRSAWESGQMGAGSPGPDAADPQR